MSIRKTIYLVKIVVTYLGLGHVDHGLSDPNKADGPIKPILNVILLFMCKCAPYSYHINTKLIHIN